MGRGFFITGTDTDVGKTWVAAGLLRALQAYGYSTAAIKPVACGCISTEQGLRNDDALVLMRQVSVNLPYEVVNPYAYAAPIAPHLAAQAAGQRIDITRIKTQCESVLRQADYVIVEGVGGWKVPLNERETTIDLAAALGLPVIVVVGMRLGCLNHALLCFESITCHGMVLAGWVANAMAPQFREIQENTVALRERVEAPLLGTIPHLAGFDVETIAHSLNVRPMLADY